MYFKYSVFTEYNHISKLKLLLMPIRVEGMRLWNRKYSYETHLEKQFIPKL